MCDSTWRGKARLGGAWHGKVFFTQDDEMKQVKCSELVIDFDLYPRNNVDTNNVRGIAAAEEAGCELPPVLADQESKRVVDGVHRLRARILRLGPDAEIDVIFKRYKDDAAIFRESMRLNAAHGQRLDSCDRTRCVIIAERLSIPLEAVAGDLHMPLDKLGDLRNTRTATSAGLSIPLKRTVSQHFAGKALTPRQVEANTKLSGMNQVFYANQLIELLESKMLDLTDEKLVERLTLLRSLLDDVLPNRRRKAA